MKITVYCSSKSNLDNKYTSTAVELGRWIGSNKHELVYGGVNAGMMHILAQSAHDAGASITGIIPSVSHQEPMSLTILLKRLRG